MIFLTREATGLALYRQPGGERAERVGNAQEKIILRIRVIVMLNLPAINKSTIEVLTN